MNRTFLQRILFLLFFNLFFLFFLFFFFYLLYLFRRLNYNWRNWRWRAYCNLRRNIESLRDQLLHGHHFRRFWSFWCFPLLSRFCLVLIYRIFFDILNLFVIKVAPFWFFYVCFLEIGVERFLKQIILAIVVTYRLNFVIDFLITSLVVLLEIWEVFLSWVLPVEVSISLPLVVKVFDLSSFKRRYLILLEQNPVIFSLSRSSWRLICKVSLSLMFLFREIQNGILI